MAFLHGGMKLRRPLPRRCRHRRFSSMALFHGLELRGMKLRRPLHRRKALPHGHQLCRARASGQRWRWGS
eukprot:scaffold121441_cov57-Phaeocystis_antarctica.AAC.1